MASFEPAFNACRLSETVSPLGQIAAPRTGGGGGGSLHLQSRPRRGPRPSSVPMLHVQKEKGVKAGDAFGKGRIVAMGHALFGERGGMEWVPHPRCSGANCRNRDAVHFIKLDGPLSGLCVTCASLESQHLREGRAAALALELRQGDGAHNAAAPGRVFGKGMVVSVGVDDGPWREMPSCLSPRCSSDPTLLVKTRGPWAGHCAPCVAQLVADGLPPFSPRHAIAGLPGEAQDWVTRPLPRVLDGADLPTAAMKMMENL